MPARTTLFRDPDGTVWRYCTGPCGRALTMDMFHLKSTGYYDTWCRRCKAVSWNGRNRRLYHTNPSYRRRRLREFRERYANNTEFRERCQERERKRVRVRTRRAA